MKILKAFKFRLKTNSATLVKLASIAGCNRFVWNKALAHQKKRLENKEYTLSYYKMAPLLLEWKKEHTHFSWRLPIAEPPADLDGSRASH
jgi:putative transposase